VLFELPEKYKVGSEVSWMRKSESWNNVKLLSLAGFSNIMTLSGWPSLKIMQNLRFWFDHAVNLLKVIQNFSRGCNECVKSLTCGNRTNSPQN